MEIKKFEKHVNKLNTTQKTFLDNDKIHIIGGKNHSKTHIKTVLNTDDNFLKLKEYCFQHSETTENMNKKIANVYKTHDDKTNITVFNLHEKELKSLVKLCTTYKTIDKQSYVLFELDPKNEVVNITFTTPKNHSQDSITTKFYKSRIKHSQHENDTKKVAYNVELLQDTLNFILDNKEKTVEISFENDNNVSMMIFKGIHSKALVLPIRLH